MSKKPEDSTIGTAALVKLLCAICWKEEDSEILLQTRDSVKVKEELERINGKPVGFMENPCKDCQKLLDKGYIHLVELDPEKSEYTSEGRIVNEKAHRTGKSAWIRKEALKEIFNTEDKDINSLVYLEQGIIDALHKSVEEQFGKALTTEDMDILDD